MIFQSMSASSVRQRSAMGNASYLEEVFADSFSSMRVEDVIGAHYGGLRRQLLSTLVVTECRKLLTKYLSLEDGG